VKCARAWQSGAIACDRKPLRERLALERLAAKRCDERHLCRWDSLEERREFIGRLVSGPALNTGAVRAQGTIRRASLGYLSGTFETEAKPFIGIFLDGLRRLGYIEGSDFVADGQYDQLRTLAQQLVDLNPDVIITPTGDVAELAIRAITQKIPIVSPTLTDPVRSGLIASYNRPGGNVTGISTLVEQLPQKQLELAVEALPGKARFGVLVNHGAGEPAIEHSVKLRQLAQH
jgi:putative ABC transport system substrate-binding protein